MTVEFSIALGPELRDPRRSIRVYFDNLELHANQLFDAVSLSVWQRTQETGGKGYQFDSAASPDCVPVAIFGFYVRRPLSLN